MGHMKCRNHEISPIYSIYYIDFIQIVFMAVNMARGLLELENDIKHMIRSYVKSMYCISSTCKYFFEHVTFDRVICRIFKSPQVPKFL